MSRTVAAGYRLVVAGPDGQVCGTVELEGYDLRAQLGALALADEIEDQLTAEAFQ